MNGSRRPVHYGDTGATQKEQLRFLLDFSEADGPRESAYPEDMAPTMRHPREATEKPPTKAIEQQ